MEHVQFGDTLLHKYAESWKSVLLFCISYLVLMNLSEAFIPHPAALFPASAVALSFLFLVGIEFWPIVLLTALVGGVAVGLTPIFLVVVPVGQCLQAIVGAHFMRLFSIDPLFRRSRDTFILLTIIVLISAISPSFSSAAALLQNALYHVPGGLSSWGARYSGGVFCLLILTPFLLRWCAKPRFTRGKAESAETIAIFSILVVLTIGISAFHLEKLGSVPTVYFLLIPFIWIALRLRPRFVTLALVITAVLSVVGLFLGDTPLASHELSQQLFRVEQYNIVLGAIFLIMVSIEEDRRLGANLLLSQVETLENAVTRISSESKAKNDFIAILAHELRNPLAPVVSMIEVLKMKEGRDPEEREALVMMEGRMETVRRLLDDLLDISRISERKIEIKKEPVDLIGVLKRSILSTAHHLNERHQTLFFAPPSEHMTVIGDSLRLEQVFSNLLANASKFSKPGDEISLTLHRLEGNKVKVIVKDKGIGIEHRDLLSIFTPFHQAETGLNSKKGLGIGLALVKSFVEVHEGSVVATSAGRNMGSEFTVVLPLIRAKEESALPSSPVSVDVSKGAGNLQVLVVDDNDVAAWSMGKLLELRGCTVSYAYTGEQAIELGISTNPDIILLDIGLPDLDGCEVAKTLRARGYGGRLIALTGYSTEDARARSVGVGFEYYLIKPAGFVDLKRAIPEIA